MMTPGPKARACDAEPIHHPGTIQDFGAMVALDPAGRITHLSPNRLAGLLGLGAGALGAPLASACPPLAASLAQAPTGARRIWAQLPPGTEAWAGWDVCISRRGGQQVVEAEPPARLPEGDALRQVGAATAELGSHREVLPLLDALTRQVRALTGFDRALIYRFDHDWHGEVLAESRDPKMPGFLGHHFPASDIPAPARRIFGEVLSRSIPDIYRPQAALAALPGAPPLDLTTSQWRSPAAIHLKYLHNMQVAASLTLSIVIDGRLWGLVACHHRRPWLVGPTIRLACEAIVAAAVGGIERTLAAARRARAGALAAIGEQLGAALRAPEGPAAGLMARGTPLEALAGLDAGGQPAAHGSAMVYEGRWWRRGTVPPEAWCQRLADHLDRHMEGDVAALPCLARSLPHTLLAADTPAGLLVLRVVKPKPTYLLWCLPEQVQTLLWAGPPDGATMGPGDGRLHPRTSFAAWRQTVRGEARAPGEEVVAAVRALRRAVVEVDLGLQVAEATMAARQRAYLMSVVAHDLRNPLGALGLTCEHLRNKVDGWRRRGEGADLDRILTSLDRATLLQHTMSRLVADVFDLTKIERGQLTVSSTAAPCAELLDELWAIFEPLARSRKVVLTRQVEADLLTRELLCDHNRIAQVLGNLLGNALKFTPEGGEVRLGCRRLAGGWSFSVADSGPGVPEDAVEQIFKPFWQGAAHRAGGAGLGLSVAQRLAEAHGGAIRVENLRTAGAQFTLELPQPPRDCAGGPASAGA